MVSNHIFILNTFKENQILGPKEVEANFGVTPQQIIDYLSITGDSSDNIPGIPGFGPKTAAELLQKFGSLENLIKHPEQIGSKKKEEAFRAGAESAVLSRKLVVIDTAVEFPRDPSFFEIKPLKRKELIDFYSEMKFTSLIKELEESAPPEVRAAAPLEKIDYHTVDDVEAFHDLMHKLSEENEICIDIEATAILPLEAELVGIGFGVIPGESWYVPANGKLGLEHVLKGIKPLLENPKLGFYGHNIKYDYHVLRNYDIKISNITFDTILASYILNSHSRQHNLDTLTLELFGKVKIPIVNLIGKGKKEISMRDVPIPQVSEYCCEDVHYTIRLKQHLEKELDEEGSRMS